MHAINTSLSCLDSYGREDHVNADVSKLSHAPEICLALHSPVCTALAVYHHHMQATPCWPASKLGLNTDAVQHQHITRQVTVLSSMADSYLLNSSEACLSTVTCAAVKLVLRKLHATYPVCLDSLLWGDHLIRVANGPILCVRADGVAGVGCTAPVRVLSCRRELLH